MRLLSVFLLIALLAVANAKQDFEETVQEVEVLDVEPIENRNNTTENIVKNDPLPSLQGLIFPNLGEIKIPTSGPKRQVYFQKRYSIMSEILEEYKHKSIDSEEIKSLALKVMKDYLDRINYRGEFLFKSQVEEECRNILKLNPKDSLTQAFIMNYLGKAVKVEPKGLDKYSTMIQALAEAWVSQEINSHNKFLATTKYLRSLEEGNEHLRYAWWMIVIHNRHSRNTKIAKYQTLLKSANDYDPWLVSMLKAKLNIEQGWQVRGGGYANTVKKKAWPIFHKHIADAKTHYLAAYEVNKHLPESTHELLSMAGINCNRKEMRHWFYETVKMEFDYHDVYTSYMWYSLPRWSGSIEELIEFGRACAATNQYDTLVPMYLLDSCRRVVEYAIKDSKNGWNYLDSMGLSLELEEVYYKSYESQKKLKRSFQQNKNFFPSLFLSMLIHTKQFDKVERFMNSFPPEYINWDKVQSSQNNLEIFTAYGSLTESDNEQFIRDMADKYLPDFSVDEIGAIDSVEIQDDYKQLSEIMNSIDNEKLNPLVNYLYNYLSFESGFQSGEWFNIDFTKHLEFFGLNTKKFKVESANTFYIESRKRAKLSMAKKFPDNMEIEYEVEHISKTGGRQCYFGVQVLGEGEDDELSLVADMKGGVAYIDVPVKGWEWGTYIPKNDSKAKVKIKLWPNYFQYDINDGDYFYCAETGFNTMTKISIGCPFSSSGAGTFRIKNLRIRKGQSTKPNFTSPEVALEYYNKQDGMMDNAGALNYLAQYYGKENQFEKAIELYQRSIDLRARPISYLEMADVVIKTQNYGLVKKLYREGYLADGNPSLKTRCLQFLVHQLFNHPDNENLDWVIKTYTQKLTSEKYANAQFNNNLQLSKLNLLTKNRDLVKKHRVDAAKLAKNKGKKKQLKQLDALIKKYSM